MAKEETKKAVMLKRCVVDGEIKKPLDEITVTKEDYTFLCGCGKAADPKTEAGKQAIDELKAAGKKAA